jgi:thioredoxin 1
MSKFREIIQSEIPTLVDFYATWCGPCQQMHPILDKLKDKMGSAVRVVKIDVDKNQEVAAKFKIRSVPTLLLFKKGEILWRQAGGMDAKGLEQKVKNAL